MQALLAGPCWDWREALAAVQRFVLDHLADPEAVLVLDETAELKKGRMTVGVARQHAGITGQVENGQTVVNCAYVTPRGHALFDFRLYLPRDWCEDQARRARAQVPADVEFATKTQLGEQMITGAIGRGVRFAWVAADEVYSRSTRLREACEKGGKGYVLAVPRDFRIHLHPGRGKVRADAAAAQYPQAPGRPAHAARAARATATTPGPGWPPPPPGSGCCSATPSPTRLTSRTSGVTYPSARRCPCPC